jgi:hypothetical protein
MLPNLLICYNPFRLNVPDVESGTPSRRVYGQNRGCDGKHLSQISQEFAPRNLDDGPSLTYRSRDYDVVVHAQSAF